MREQIFENLVVDLNHSCFSRETEIRNVASLTMEAAPVSNRFLTVVNMSHESFGLQSLRVQCGEANSIMKGLILAQNERWRRGLGMQVEREPFELA